MVATKAYRIARALELTFGPHSVVREIRPLCEDELKAQRERDVRCKICGKRPPQIEEYRYAGSMVGLSSVEYVIRNEGTYNQRTKKFYCTDCYIKIGSPLGTA